MAYVVLERFNGKSPIVLERVRESVYKIISEDFDWTAQLQLEMERGQAGNATPC